MLCILLPWLLVIFYANGSMIDDFVAMTNDVSSPREDYLALPVEIGTDRKSGCICRATKSQKIIVCFGNYVCRRFPKVMKQSDALKVRTTVIERILKGDLDEFSFLTVLEIDANHKLTYIEPGTFRNLTKLQHLSISYNTALRAIDEHIFEGLGNLRNLTLVNNGFDNVLHLTVAMRPSILPMLKALDLSENSLELINEDSFAPMEGTSLRKLDINLCSLCYIHPNSFLPLKKLKELYIGDNELNSTLIGNFLMNMMNESINLTYLDLSGLGFRRQPPKELLHVIAQTSIKKLNLAHNQFESINDDTFPRMVNIELLDLRRVQAIYVGPYAFDPSKFPNLKALFLGGNNLPGIHQKHLSTQLLLLDLSNNKGTHATVFYEIDRDTFVQSTKLRILNLAYNKIKSIFDYTFRGLEKLKLLNLENGTIFFIGEGTFKSTKQLEVLNLANNPLTANQNLTCAQFEGLNYLRIFILKNCGVKRFNDDDNLFEMMPNLTHLILRNNQLFYITAETLKPLKNLQVLDLSENLLISWWRPLFLASGVKPQQLLLTNNKISHFSISMIEDISYLLEESNSSTEIDLMDNVFVCDCSAMYKTYLWLEVNGSIILKKYFESSNFLCSSPDLWEDRRVAEYLTSVKSLNCLMYAKISNVMVIVWTAPSLVTIVLILLIGILLYKYRVYIRYWIFLGKIAIGRKFIRRSVKADDVEQKGYKYDAFISYCFEDRDFVLDMITYLETYPPYLKLCVSERDFEIGSFLSEAILSSINESKYVVLLISNNFAKSQWCRWETQLAEYHRLFLEDGTSYDPLVLVRLGHVEKKYLTPTLKYLLKTKIYLSWDENNSEEFWKKLRNAFGKKI
ncbi:protein artichoke-like [Pectinophora gossypiella]|uniref:protein artichoke-like n=1 Tax=Pectinophora gossypiella TaxID=13191 RepID=UPI00214E9BD4|nr:protein artichoke-like [Pectinophora gossypiella]